MRLRLPNVAIFLALLIALPAMACSSDPSSVDTTENTQADSAGITTPIPTATETTSPTATTSPPTPTAVTETVQPQPTPTAVPTSTPQPTLTPTPEPTSTPVPIPTRVPTPAPEDPNDLIPVRGPIKPLPAELDPDQTGGRPVEERVIALWTELLSDSVLPINGYFPSIGDLHFCGDGTVISVAGHNNVGLWLDTTDKWLVRRTASIPDSEWWKVVLTTFFSPDSGRFESSYSLITVGVESGKPAATYLGTTSSLEVYESEYCKSR